MEKALPSSITSFHDSLANELPKSLGKWSFELKIYLNNKYSKPDNYTIVQIPNKYLVSLQTSYLPNKTVSMINNSKAIVTTHALDEDNDKELEQFESGASTSLDLDPFDFLITNKFQSMWILKQTIKGESGFGYEIQTNNINIDEQILNSLPLSLSSKVNNRKDSFRIRTANCSLHGSFKGFLIEIEYLDDESDLLCSKDDPNYNEIQLFHVKINKIKELIKNYRFPNGKLCYNVLNEDRLDYLSDLVQQYSEALQF